MMCTIKTNDWREVYSYESRLLNRIEMFEKCGLMKVYSTVAETKTEMVEEYVDVDMLDEVEHEYEKVIVTVDIGSEHNYYLLASLLRDADYEICRFERESKF